MEKRDWADQLRGAWDAPILPAGAAPHATKIGDRVVPSMSDDELMVALHGMGVNLNAEELAKTQQQVSI